MPKNTLSIGLFDPGMTQLHRVGLAGLYMSLKHLPEDEFQDLGEWRLEPHRITFEWKSTPSDLLTPIIERSFGISSDGRVDFLAHRYHPMGAVERFKLHHAIRFTYLQHPKVCKTEKQVQNITLEMEGHAVIETIKRVIAYENQKAFEKLFNPKGAFKKSVKLAGWLFPGGAVRHTAHTTATSLTADPVRFLTLVYAPVASLYFLISDRGRDGRFDQRKKAAIVLPDVRDLASFHRCYTRFLRAPVHHLYANSLGDAGMLALTLLRLMPAEGGMVGELDIDTCTVVTFGRIDWSRQETRTGLEHVTNVDVRRLNLFEIALRTLENRVVIRKEEQSFYVTTSLARGLIAENVAANREWFRGFHKLMVSRQLARLVSYERKGLSDMVEKAEWPFEADRVLVEAVHRALRNRYGAMAQRARQRGEAVNFNREFERIRSSLMRTKNAQTLRAELADLFARGGLNQTLQDKWKELLPLFTGPDWQRARDLALLGLASYSGRGAEEIEADVQERQEQEG